MILDVTFGVVEWTTKKIFSYVWRNNTAKWKSIKYDAYEDIIEVIDKQQHQLVSYREIVEQQQNQINTLIRSCHDSQYLDTKEYVKS